MLRLLQWGWCNLPPAVALVPSPGSGTGTAVSSGTQMICNSSNKSRDIRHLVASVVVLGCVEFVLMLCCVMSCVMTEDYIRGLGHLATEDEILHLNMGLDLNEADFVDPTAVFQDTGDADLAVQGGPCLSTTLLGAAPHAAGCHGCTRILQGSSVCSGSLGGGQAGDVRAASVRCHCCYCCCGFAAIPCWGGSADGLVCSLNFCVERLAVHQYLRRTASAVPCCPTCCP